MRGPLQEESSATSSQNRNDLDQQVDAFAKQTAAAEEAQYIAALADAQEQGRKQAGESSASSQPARPAPQNKAPRSTSAQSMREAALAKLAKARQCVAAKADPAAEAAGGVLNTLPPGSTVEQPPSVSLPTVKAAGWGKSAAGSSQEVLFFEPCLPSYT